LSGFVNSQADINRAIVVTRTVLGVTSVTNKMQLK
jgi:osmotically-inducible protein OsmY